MSRNPPIPVALLLALAVTAAPTARAADQTVLGTALTVKDLRSGRKPRANVRVRGFRRRRKNPVRGPYLPFAGRDQDALRAVARTMPAVERGGGGVYTYTGLICRCCEALWRLGRADFADVLERNLLAKTLAGDFRDLGVDARLAMAQLCALMGRPGEAHQWFELAEALRAQCEQAGVDRIETVAGPPVSSVETGHATAEPTSPPAARFRHEGDFWTLAYQGAECRVKDAKGLRYIAYLLRHPGREFHVLDLVATVKGDREAEGEGRSRTARVETGDRRALRGEQGLPVLDATAKVAYQQRLVELRDEMDEADRFNDPGRAERARTEMDAITEQLAAAVGLGGRDRQAASSSERARSTVTKVVKAALNRISDHHAALGRHLTTSIRTGTFSSYARDEPPAPWAF